MDFTILKSISKSIEQVLEDRKIGRHATNTAPRHLLIVYMVHDACMRICSLLQAHSTLTLYRMYLTEMHESADYLPEFFHRICQDYPS